MTEIRSRLSGADSTCPIDRVVHRSSETSSGQSFWGQAKARLSSPTTALILFVCGLMLIKFVVAAYTPLASDEALYWRYSKHLAAGFIDHPFMNPLMIRLGTSVFGDTSLGVRFMAVALSLPASWAVWRAASALFDDAGLARTAVVYFNLTVVMTIGSLVATSDQVVVTTTCFLLLFLAELQRTGRGERWLAAGAAFGFGLCSKYTTAFFAVSILAWLIAVPAQRKWLASPWMWAGGLVALAIFTPVLMWNAQHRWASLVYQSGRLTVYIWTLRYLLELTSALVILATPPIFVLGCIGLFAPGSSRQDRPGRVLIVSMIAPMMIYFIWHATHERVQGNWPEPAYPAFAIAAAYAVHRLQLGRRLGPVVLWARRLAAPFGLLLALIAYAEATTGFLPLGRHDPRTRVLGVGWKTLAAEIEALRSKVGARVILTTDYTLNSLTELYLPSSTPVVQISDRMRWSNEPQPDPRLFQGQALYICKNACSKLSKIDARFSLVKLLAVLQQDPRTGAGARYSIYQVSALRAPALDPQSRIFGADHEDR